MTAPDPLAALVRERPDHAHCWHGFYGPLMMVVPDGHVVEKCCSCEALRTVHRAHR